MKGISFHYLNPFPLTNQFANCLLTSKLCLHPRFVAAYQNLSKIQKFRHRQPIFQLDQFTTTKNRINLLFHLQYYHNLYYIRVQACCLKGAKYTIGLLFQNDFSRQISNRLPRHQHPAPFVFTP